MPRTLQNNSPPTPPPDPEEVLRVIAQLRHEHPDASPQALRGLVDWPALRRVGETYEEFMARHYGPVEPL